MKNKLSMALTMAVIFAMMITSLAFAGTPSMPASQTATPTISSDLPDYGPGDTVNLFGAGWQAGESVHIFVNDSFGSSWSRNVDVVAADDGSITDTFQLPSWFVANYSVTATGVLSGTVITAFTDASATISGTVLNDANGNGVDDGESGLAGAIITIYQDKTSGSGIVVGSWDSTDTVQAGPFTTTSTGIWSLDVPVDKTYFVVETDPTGYATTNSISGSDSSSNITTTKVNNNQFKVVVAKFTGSTVVTSSGNKFLDQTTCTAPSTSNPSSATKTVGESVTFSVTASGTAPLSYQWRKGGIDISGANSSSYTIASVVSADAGSYDVVVTGTCGSPAASSAATLTVNKANATINVTPYTATYDGNSHTASGTATGVGGVDLSSLLNLSGTAHTNAGTYAGDAWSFAGNSDYNSASGTVNDKINKADANITVTPYDVTYNGVAHTATGTAIGVETIQTNTPGSWQSRAGMLQSRTWFGAAESGGKIYVFGGLGSSNPMWQVEEYDPNTNIWLSRTSMLTARKATTAVAINGKIYVIGGMDSSHAYVNTVEEYSPTTNTWQARAGMPISIGFASAVAADNGKIYIIGGYNGTTPLNTVLEYDPIADTWQTRASMSTARYALSAVFANGKIYAIGGQDNFGAIVSTVEEYDLATDTWTTRASTPTPRCGTGGALADNGRIYIIGGGSCGDYIYDTVEEYEPLTDTWATETSMPTARQDLKVVSFGGKIYAIGGDTRNANMLTTVEEYTPPVYTLDISGDLSSLLTLSDTSHTNSGDYPTDAWSFAGNDNYNTASGTVHDKIAQASSTTTVTVSDATYDGNPHGGTASATGAGSLNQSLTVSYEGRNGTVYALSTTAPTNAGDYTASASFAGDVNHTGSLDSKDFSIAKADALVTVTGWSGTYNAVAHGATGTAKGVGGVDLSAGLDLGDSFTDVPGGTANWTFDGGTNYLDESGTAAINIAQADADVTINPYTGTYDAAEHNLIGSVVGVAGDPTAVGSSLTFGAGYTDAGNHTGTWNFAGGTNYKDQSGTAAIDIAQADADVTINPYTGTYDAAEHNLAGSVVGVAGDLTAVGSSLTFGAGYTDAGNHTGTWNFAGGMNYKDQSGTAAINIAQANADVTINPYTGTYDAAEHNLTGSVVGVAGDPTAVGSSLTFGAGYTDAGNHTGTWNFAGGTNYLDESGTAAIDIAQADADVTINLYTGTYDAAEHNLTGSVVGVAGDPTAVGSSLTFGAGFTNAGNHTGTWNFAGGTNYKDQSGTAAINIAQADADVTINLYTGTYDAAEHNLTGSVVGVAGDPTAVGSNLTFGAGFTNAGNHTGTWNFAGGTNYKDQSGTAAIDIAQADADVTINPYTGTYDAAEHNLTGSVVGVAGDLTAVGSSLTFGAGYTDAGNHTGTWNFAGGMNYKDQSGTAAINIAQADADVTINPYTSTYDAAEHNLTGSVVGVAGDPTAVGSSLTFGAGYTDAGNHTGTWNFEGGTNYLDESGTAAIDISKADAKIIVTAYDVIYNGAPHTATGTAKGVKGESLAGLDLSGTTHTDASGILGYWDTWMFTDETGNYNNASSFVIDHIAKANAVINVTEYTGVYDGNSHGASGTAVGVESTPADLNSLLHLGASFTNVPGGTAHWTFDGNDNYNSTSSNVAITINQALLTVTADNKSMIFGNPLPPFTFQYSGWVNGENASVVDTAPTCNVGLIPMYGTYPITCSGGLDNNYSFKYVNGSLTVQAWTLKGFYQPVDMGISIVNTVKGGSTVPLKFEVFAGSIELTNTAIVSTLLKQVTCTALGEDTIEVLVTGGTSLRYDTVGGQFIFNWQTPKLPGKCYSVTLTTQDGSFITALFKLK